MILVSVLLGSWSAFAAEPVSEAVAGPEVEPALEEGQTASEEVQKAPESEGLDPNRMELAGLPVVAFDSNTGLQLGGLVALAGFAPGYFPYRWRLETILSASVLQNSQGDTEFPMHDDYVILDLPGLLDGLLRLKGRVGYQQYLTMGYYGLGNNANLDKTRIEDNYWAYYCKLLKSGEIFFYWKKN